MSFCEGFAPVVNENSKVLILGSMPSIKSLEHQQYYAHPQNRFWPLMAKLLNYQETPADYNDRLQMLLTHKIALWDSLCACEREGSLDSAIEKEVPNDFTAFLKQYPQIKTICFNGGKSQQAFKKYNKNLLKNSAYTFYAMPSTSPANARFRLEMLAEKWQIILTALA